MSDTYRIYRHEFYHPQENFSKGNVRKNPEARFAEQFSEAYQEKFIRLHAGTVKKNTLFIREVPVAGNGIADLLVFNWRQDLSFEEFQLLNLEQLNPTIRAFEFKLSHWRNGLMQAYRYKYFSHVSLLVVPKQKIRLLVSQLPIFKTLRVGLWGFEPETGVITDVFTPRPRQQQVPKYGQKVMRLAAQVVSS